MKLLQQIKCLITSGLWSFNRKLHKFFRQLVSFSTIPAANIYKTCLQLTLRISQMYHITVTQTKTHSWTEQGSLLKDPSLCWEQSSFVPACFHLQCPLLVRLRYCRPALSWYFSSTMMVFVTHLLGKLVWILTSMPSDPGVPEGPGGPGRPWGPGGPLWKKQKELF